MAIALDAAFVANGLIKSLTQSDTEILDGMVIIDMGVAYRFDVEVDQPMAGNLIQHVVEKGYTGFTVEPPLAIEIDRNRNLGLLNVTGDGGDSLGHVGLSLALYASQDMGPVWPRALSGRANHYACRHGPLIIENRSPHPLQCAHRSRGAQPQARRISMPVTLHLVDKQNWGADAQARHDLQRIYMDAPAERLHQSVEDL